MVSLLVCTLLLQRNLFLLLLCLILEAPNGTGTGNAFVTTAYFIDPMRICNGGRTQEEFDVEGTGNRLLFQNGPTANDVMVIPLTLDSIDADTTWFRHYCFLNMGRHYFQLNYDVNAPCVDLTPIQLIYSGGVLNGFVWQ